METGLFKGGTAILMMRMLNKFDKCNRQFWGFDSFEGLPEPVSEDMVGNLAKGKRGRFSYGLAGVMQNFENAGVDPSAPNVHIVKGFFNDTLPTSPVKDIAFLRLDGDLFVSTWDPLENLYEKVVPGGYIYVDDYGSYNGCREAVDLFRSLHRIEEPMNKIFEDRQGNPFEAVWWQKGHFEQQILNNHMAAHEDSWKNN